MKIIIGNILMIQFIILLLILLIYIPITAFEILTPISFLKALSFLPLSFMLFIIGGFIIDSNEENN